MYFTVNLHHRLQLYMLQKIQVIQPLWFIAQLYLGVTVWLVH